MKYRKSPTFNKCLAELPEEIQKIAKEKFKLLKDNPNSPYHPSLRIKPMKGFEGIWEGHISKEYVFTFNIIKEDKEIVFVFRKIGKHAIYDNP